MGMLGHLLCLVFTRRYSDRRARLERECLEMAETSKDMETALNIGLDYVETIQHFRTEEAITRFNRCLEIFESDPKMHDKQKHRLMWMYKWIVGSLDEFATISLAAMERAFADMERRFTGWGYNLRAVHGLRLDAALAVGQMADAARWLSSWQETPRDESADCEACEADRHVGYLLATGRDGEARELARPLFTGVLTCESVPATTYSSFLLPTLKSGDRTLAQHYQDKSVGTMRQLRQLYSLGEHLTYLALTGQFAAAAKIAGAFTPIAVAHKSDRHQLEFFLGLQQLGLSLAHANVSTVPCALPMIGQGRKVTPAELLAWVTPQCAAWSKALDQRNGNNLLGERLHTQSPTLN